MTPGIYEMSNHDYHKVSGLSCSAFKELLRSPAHYQYYLKERIEPTKFMNRGTAIHTAILEPEKFETEIIVEPEFAPKKPSTLQRQAKKPSPETVNAIKFWDDFAEKAQGKTVISHDDLGLVAGMAEGVKGCEAAVNLLSSGFPELSVFATDPQHGFLWKARPDWLTPAGACVDVKKCQDASPQGFQKQIGGYGYHIQAALYMQVLTWATGKEHNRFFFIAIEEKPPHCCAVFELDYASLDAARLKIQRGAALYADCLKNDKWPGYSGEIQTTGAPRWAL
jgi:hypothetical protein